MSRKWLKVRCSRSMDSSGKYGWASMQYLAWSKSRLVNLLTHSYICVILDTSISTYFLLTYVLREWSWRNTTIPSIRSAAFLFIWAMFSLGSKPTRRIIKQWVVCTSLPYILCGVDCCHDSRHLNSRRVNMSLYWRKISLAGNAIATFRTCLNWSHTCKRNSTNCSIKRRQR